MPLRSRPQTVKTDWGQLGITAAQSGDLVSAKAYLGRAVRTDRQTPVHRFNLAIVHERLGEIEEAVQQLSEAVRASPGLVDAVRRLAQLLTRFRLSDYSVLEPFGLRIAMGVAGVNPQPLAEAAFERLAAGGLAPVLAEVAAKGAEATALRLIERRCADVVRDDLLLAALEAGPNRNPRIEPLLVALRKGLLMGLDAERYGDKAVQALAIAIGRQAAANEYVWPVSEAERFKLAALAVERSGLAGGEVEAGRRLLLAAMYQPIETIVPGLEAGDCEALRPKGLRDLVLPRLAEAADEASRVARFRSGPVLADAISQRVAAQYEGAPYPRWARFTAPTPGSIRVALQRYIPEQDLAWFDLPFDVLVAGCGTGNQALQSAIGYGPNARLTAIDISARSLAYAERKAEELGIETVTFRRADILELESDERTYKVIECVGVLHHMADPFEGWRRLLAKLEPGGLMYVGLYSKTARRDLETFHQSTDYPRPGCSDDAARAFRASLMAGSDSPLKQQLLKARDFYALGEFRDLLLNVHEMPLQLPEIDTFLSANGLRFRGFTIDPVGLSRFAARFPESKPPGTLAEWHEVEQAEPRTFDSMYRFWCERDR